MCGRGGRGGGVKHEGREKEGRARGGGRQERASLKHEQMVGNVRDSQGGATGEVRHPTEAAGNWERESGRCARPRGLVS